MKVNEKIQYYRKKAGFSQEELGKRLMVSRQTVSLWETGQTLPTLDNLVRLREIFGTSIDELLIDEGGQAEVGSDESGYIPYESYSFVYSKEDLKRIFGIIFTPSIIIFALFFTMFIGSVISLILTSKPRFDHGVILSASLVCLLTTSFVILHAIKGFRNTKKDSLLSVCTLEVFSDRFVFEKRIDGSLYKSKTVLFSRIKSIARGKDFLSVYAEDEIYNFKYDWIAADSLLYSITANRSNTEKDSSAAKKVAKPFFLLSLISILALPLIISIDTVSHAAIAWLVTSSVILISSTSIIMGIILFINDEGGTKELASGILSLLLILGIFIPIIQDNEHTPIEDAEYYMGIDFPKKYNGMNINPIEEQLDKAYVYYIAEYYFEDAYVSEFEARLKEDPRWLNSIEAKKLLALYPKSDYHQGAEYFLFYEFSTGFDNYLPRNNEFASYILVSYFIDENILIISEFDCNNQ